MAVFSGLFRFLPHFHLDGHSGPREGGWDPGGAPQHPLHTVDFLVSLGRASVFEVLEEAVKGVRAAREETLM